MLFIITKICGLVFAVNPLRDMPILGSSNSDAKKKRNMMPKYGQMGIQLYDGVENIIVVKGEIARYEQFLLLPQCFKKLSVVEASK